MHHATTVGPVLDENDKPVPGTSFHIKGLLESNHAGQLLSDDQFAALVVDDVQFTRTAGGGFEYSIEVVVSEGKLAQIVADREAAARATADADAKASKEQQQLQAEAKAQAEEAAIAAEGRRAALVEQAKQQELAKLQNVPPSAT